MKQKELEHLAAHMVRGPRDADLYTRVLEAAAVTRRGLELLEEVAELAETSAPLRPLPANLAEAELGEISLPHEAGIDANSLAAEGGGSLSREAGEGRGGGLHPGDPLVRDLDPDAEEVHTDLLDEAAQQVSFALAAGSVRDLADTLARLTDSGLREQMTASIQGLLETMASEDLDRLRSVVDRWPTVALDPSWPDLLARAVLPDVEDVEGERGDRLRFAGDRLQDAMALLKTGKEMLQEVASLLTAEIEPEETTALPPRSTRRPADRDQLERALRRAAERHETIEAAWEVLTSEEAPFARRWAAGVHLCRQTRELVRIEPSKAAAWAARVGKVTEALAAPGSFEARMATHLRTFANAHVGNALRVQGHLIVAERFFLPWDEDDPLGLRAEYLALKATLRRVQRRPAEAIALFEEAERIASRGDFPGANELVARIRIAHAYALAIMSEFDSAAALLRATLIAPTASPDSVPSSGDLSPRLRYIGLQNLADYLSKAGQLEEAGKIFAEVERLGVSLTLPEIDLVRTQWVRARLEHVRAWHTGADSLKAVREQLLKAGLIYDAALASLELAEWHAEDIRGTEEDAEHVTAIRELATESAAFFAGQDVGPEALAAIALFQYVSSVTTPTVPAIRKIERLLRQAVMT